MKIMFRTILLAVAVSTLGYTANAQKLIPIPFDNPEWSKPHEPFRIAGNLYFVGTWDLGIYLVTTPEGHILINTGLDRSLPMIKKSIAKLGFKYKDIRILLCMQAHYDHTGALADIQKETGAQMMADWRDAPALEDGGNSDYVMGGKGSMVKPVRVDRLLRDGNVISLGGTSLTMLHHPGHTLGSNSYLLTVKDEKRSYRVLIANMPTILDPVDLHGMDKYPDVDRDFDYTFKSLKKQQFDIWLAAHGSQFNLHKKYKRGAYNPMAFSDRKEYDDAIAELYKKYIKKQEEDKK